MKKMLIKWFWNRKIKITQQKIDAKEVKSILFLKQKENAEQMLESTAVFREIKKRYPEIKIGVVISKKAKEILKNNPNIDIIYVYDDEIIREIRNQAKEIKKHKYEAIIESDLPEKTLEKLGISAQESDLSCDIHISDHNLYRAQAFKSFLNGKKMIVIYGAEICSALLKDIEELSKSENNTIVILSPEENRVKIKNIIKVINGNIYFPMIDGFQDVIALISIADETITTDSLVEKISDSGRKECLEK